MLRLRRFSNTDPPLLADLWQTRAGQRGLRQPLSVELLEQFVLGKLYFEPEGLVLALDDERPVGFAHAGFGPDSARTAAGSREGVTCVVMVRPGCDEAAVAAELLQHMEAYLLDRGATILYGGPHASLNPFYFGLYGATQSPGVLDSDTIGQQLYRTHGYDEVDRTLVFRRDLASFRPVVDRQQVQLRRQMIVEMQPDPAPRDWWEASLTCNLDVTRFEVKPRGAAHAVASATFHDIDRGPSAPTSRAAGLMDVAVDPSLQRKGVGTFLLGESFRRLLEIGITGIETHAPVSSPGLVQLLRKLGMVQIGEGTVFAKHVDPAARQRPQP